MLRINTLKMVCLGSLLASSIVNAAPACDSFQIKVKNSLADGLRFDKVELVNAQIQPSGLHELAPGAEQIFKVSGSNPNLTMAGNLVFKTFSFPTKEVKISFNLMNSGDKCGFVDYSPASDYSLDMAGSENQIFYNIINK